MIVESMNDREFVLEVTRDYFDDIRHYIVKTMTNEQIKNRHSNDYTSTRGNKWHFIYRPEYDGQFSLHVRRPQPKNWFTWYSLIFQQESITLFGFNKHVAERISERYHPELSPTEALKEMLMKTPAIVQIDTGKEFYTRVNGGVCIGDPYGRRYSINIGIGEIHIDLRDTNTFVSDDLLFNDQKMITEESIVKAIKALGNNYLPDNDRKDH